MASDDGIVWDTPDDSGIVWDDPLDKKEEPGLLSGTGDYILDIGRKLKSGTGKTISSLGWLAELEGMEKYGTEMSEAGEAAMTPLGAERSKRTIFTPVDNPALQANYDAMLGSIPAAPYSMFSPQSAPGLPVRMDPAGLAKIPYAIAESVPGMATGMAAAFVAPKLIPTAGQVAIGSLAVRALGPLARSVPKSPAALAAFGTQVVGTGTIASSEALLGGAMSGQQTEKEALAYLTKNPGALQESEGGLAALEETNGDVDAAAKLLAARMGMEAFYKVGAATGILSIPGAALQSRLTAGVANKGLLKEAGIGAVGEGSQEGPQSAAEAFFSGDIMGQIDPSKKPTFGGVLSAGLEGALIGAPMGGGMGVVGSVLSSKQDPAETLDGMEAAARAELEAAVQAMVGSRDAQAIARAEEARAAALQRLNEINEARQLLLPPPPKTIGGEQFGGEDIIDVARENPDLVSTWKTILDSPNIRTNDELRVALLAAVGQPPTPTIQGQRYDREALARAGAQSQTGDYLRRMGQPAVDIGATEDRAYGATSPYEGLNPQQIIDKASTNRGQNPTLDAILDSNIDDITKSLAIVKYDAQTNPQRILGVLNENYDPSKNVLYSVPEQDAFTPATIASEEELEALRQKQAARQAAAEQDRLDKEEEARQTQQDARDALLGTRPRTDEGTGGAGQAAIDLATQPNQFDVSPYSGPSDERVINYLRGLEPDTDVSLVAMQEAIRGLTKKQAQDAIKGNTGKLGQRNTLLVMKNGKPTTQPARGPGAPDTTASSPLGAATNIEDMTGTRRTDLSETAGEGVTPERVEETRTLTDQERIDTFIDSLTGGQDFTPNQAQVATRKTGPKAVSFQKINARIKQLIGEGRIIPFGDGFKRVGTENDARRMIFDHPAFQPLNVTDIARDTGLPYGDVLNIARRYVKDPSASETTRGLTQQSDNLLIETATSGVFVRTGAKAPSLPAGNRKMQRSVAGGTSPNLDRVLAEAAAKNGQPQPQTTAQTEPADQPTPAPGSNTRLQPVYDEDGFVTSTRTVSADTPLTEDYKGLSLDLLQEKLELSLQNAATARETIAKIGDHPMLVEAIETENKKIEAIKSLMSAAKKPKTTTQSTAQQPSQPQPKPKPASQAQPAAQPQQTASPEENIAPTPSLGGTVGAQALGLTEATAGQEAPQGASTASGEGTNVPTSKEALAKARKVVAEKLRQLRASGKVGAEVANRISQLLKDPNFDVEQIMRSFAVADALSKTFGGTDANLRVEFYREILDKDPATDKFVHVAGEAGASVGDVRGLIRISLSKDLSASLARDTAFHEGFHFLQDMINEYDPKTAEFLFGKRIGSDPDNGRGVYAGGAFRDGMTLADIDPTIKRSLQNAAPEKGGPSYWDILKGRYDSSESLRSDFADQREAVAYVFGALADAQNNGSQLGGLKPAFRRFLNMLTRFAQNLRNAFRGYGYTNTNEILSKFASGKKQKGYGRDIEGDFSGSTGQRQTQRAFVGRNSENWPFQKQRLAEAMEDQGFTPMQVWKSTGLHRGDEDDLWRNEIPDFKAKLNITPEISVRDGEDTLGNILKHDDLFQEYPFLEYVDIFTSNQLEEGSALTTDDGDIYISGRDVSAINSGYMNKRDLAARKKELISSILHEVQHVIQRREGFKTGSSAARERDKIEETIHDEMQIIRDAYEDAERPLYNAIRSLERVIASEFPDGDKFDAVNVIRFLKTGKDLYRGKHKDLEAAVIKKYLPQSKIEKINGALWDNEAYGITVKDLEEGLANSYLGNAFANYMKVSGERESRDVQYRFEGRVRKEPPQAILESENLQNIIRTHDEIAAEVAIEYENGFKELLEKLKADNEQYAREIGPSKTALKRLDAASRRAWKKSMSERVAEEETQPQKSTYSPKERKAKVQRAWVGQKSANWQFPVQNAAEAMEASGMKWQDIYWNTGLHRGENDRLWRSEIPDVDAKINDKELSRFVFDPANYGRVKLPVVYDHPDIYEEYPFLKDVYLIKLPPAKDKMVSGYADLDKKEVGVAIDFLEDHTLGSKAKYPDEVRKILTHEIQHFIQDHEGFDGGSSAGKVISVSKNMASNILGLINNAYYNKVKDPLDDLAEKANRYLLKDIKAQYPDLRIDLKGFMSGFGMPEFWKVDGAKVSQVRDLDLMNKVLKHPDFAIANKARDLLEEGARAVEAKNELVQTTLDELTPEKARERYRAAYGERESRDTEERLKLATKEQRRSTLPGSLDKTPLTVAGQYVFEDPEFDVFENDEFLNDVRDQINDLSNDLSDQISGKSKPKTQRSVAGDTDAYAFKRGSIADTNTIAFKRWFKNSVVRAPDTFKMIIDPKTGQRIREAIMVPLKVYHGGSFMRGRDIPMMGKKDGPDFPYDFMHFGTKASALARTSAFNEAEAEAKGFDITPAYLSIQKPKYVKDQGTTAKWSKVVEQAKAEGYDGLIYTNEYEDVGSTSYVIFDPGQAKSTDNVGTFNFADPRMERAFAGKRPNPPKKSIADLDKNLQEIRDAGGRKGFINTGKRAAALSNWITTKFDPKGTLPRKDVYRILRNLLMGNVKAIEVNANARRMIIEKGTKEQRRQIFDYFKTKNAVLPNTMPADLRDAAMKAKAEIAYIGQQLVAKGILSKKQVEAEDGQYLPRLYMQYLKEAKGFGTGSLRGSNRDYAMRREDIPEDIRKAMGEILEPGLPYMKAAVQPVRDMAIIDFLSDVASFEDAEWVAKGDLIDWRGTKVSPFWLSEQMRDVRDNMLYFQDDPVTLASMKKVADEMQAIIDKTDMRENVGKDFKRLPNTSRYGALRGMAVRKEIYDDVVGMGVYTGDLDFFSKLFSSGGAVPRVVNFWKLSKTVFSPTTHARQFFSNMITADISGINMYDIPVRMVQAIDDMINDTGGWKIAKENGVTATGMVDQELRSALNDLKKIARASTGGVFSVVDLNKWSDHWITKMSPSNLYQGSDYLFKTMKIIDEMNRYEKKLGPAKNTEDRRLREGAAVLEANEWFMDYSDVHNWVKSARQMALPFVTYQYKIAPKIAETLLKNPQRFAKYVALFYAAPALAMAMMDLDDDDMERLKQTTKSYIRKNPHAIPLPWQDASGDFQFLDIGYLFPWSFMSGLVVALYNTIFGDSPVSELAKASSLFGSPMITVPAAALTNVDTFSGQKIINEYDTPVEKAKDVLGYIWGQAMPPIITNYGAIGAPLADWFSGNRGDIDRKGNPTRDTAQLWAQAFGFNIYPVNPAQQFAQNVTMMQNDINRARADLSTQIRDKSMSPENRRKMIEDRNADIRRRIEKMQKYIAEARPTERLIKK